LRMGLRYFVVAGFGERTHGGQRRVGVNHTLEPLRIAGRQSVQAFAQSPVIALQIVETASFNVGVDALQHLDPEWIAIVRLTDSERALLRKLFKKPRVSVQKVLRACCSRPMRMDLTGPRRRSRMPSEGFEITLNGRPKHRARGKILDGHQEVQIMRRTLKKM
jgi:hypothetical protein